MENGTGRRGRGRPRKDASNNFLVPTSQELNKVEEGKVCDFAAHDERNVENEKTLVVVKKKRGRPRKTQAAVPKNEQQSSQKICRKSKFTRLADAYHSSRLEYMKLLDELTAVKEKRERMRKKCVDTIFALASGSLPSPIGIIRTSGKGSLEIFEKITASPLPKTPRLMYLRRFVHPKTHQTIDHGLAVYFKAPNSFTGEDSVEFHCHGGVQVLSSMYDALSFCERVLKWGRGSFDVPILIAEEQDGPIVENSQKAVLSGRMDLYEAEAIRCMIEATTGPQLKSALDCMSGRVRRLMERWRTLLISSVCEHNAIIDFGEDHASDGAIASSKHLLGNVSEMVNEMERFVQKSENLKANASLSHNIVIMGAPNVGKSSLLNVLAERPAAIVSHLPGTTRDAIEIALETNTKVRVTLIDTAGIDRNLAAVNEVDRMGREKSIQLASEADALLLVMVDEEEGTADNIDERVREKIGQLMGTDSVVVDLNRLFVVLNKLDLVSGEDRKKPLPTSTHFPITRVSCLTMENIDLLRRNLNQFIDKKFSVDDEEDESTISHRQISAVQRAIDELKVSLEHSGGGDDMLIQTQHLTNALSELSKIAPELGAASTDDILNEIFSRFCIGK